ncbi:MAG: translation elongation factor Ts [Flavobacteriales bacterium]|nr:translation elongation factor Ts [Flavobacteriales bacterium]
MESTVNITAAQVNELRKKTGAGMMDCKKALVEAGGDFDTAIDLLRKQGQKVAAKRSDREAAEGIVLGKVNGNKAILLNLGCETDFVAKTDDFVGFANDLLDLAFENNITSADALVAATYKGASVSDAITELTGKTGEKVEVSGFEVIVAETVVAYNHPGNRVGTIVGLNKAGFEEMGRDVAMQAAAMAPVALNKESVSAEVIAKEIEIGKELAIQEGKPADMAEKIAEGRLGKFFKENTLMEQAFIKDNKLNVAQYLKSGNPELTVTAFKRFSLGS